MTTGDWHWLSVGWCVLGGVVLTAWMGHKLRWAQETSVRERLRHYTLIGVAGAAVGWCYFYVAPYLWLLALSGLGVPIAGWLFGLFVLVFTLCLPFSVLTWLHVTGYETFILPKIQRRWDNQLKAERRLRRDRLGLPQED